MSPPVLIRHALVATALAVVTPTVVMAEPEPCASSVSAGLISAYVSEGRECFDASPAFEGVASISWTAWSLEVANIKAFENDGVEWSATMAYEGAMGRGAYAVGVSHIRDTFEGVTESDSEVGLGLAWPVGDRLEVFVEGTYAFGAKGYYGTVGFDYAVPTPDTFGLNLTGGMSWNDGYYESAGVGGADVVLMRLDVNVPLTTRWSIGGFLSQAWALRGLELDGGGDVTFTGLSFAAEF